MRLLEGFIQHQARIGLGDVVSVTAHRTDQHRQPGDQRFKQHGTGVFVVCRVDQQIGTQQETRNIAAALEERHVIAKPQRRALHLE
ncbi:hypothetical protein D3C87_1880260 [compost metagenome]